jgi:hypothetical protein
MLGNRMIRKAANTSSKRLKDISLVWPRRSASNPLGSNRNSEKMRGIAIIMLAMRIDSLYSLIRIGKRALGRFV